MPHYDFKVAIVTWNSKLSLDMFMFVGGEKRNPNSRIIFTF
jgi:hypothetical protein